MAKQKVLLKKILVAVILFLFIFICNIPTIAIDTKNLYQISESEGIYLYVGGGGPNNYTKIQDAIDDASDGDTVYVFDDSSPYFENLIVNKTIYLIGEDMNSTVIDGKKISSVVNISADGIIVSGFTIQNSGNDIFDHAGIMISSNHNKIIGNIIRYNEDGIFIKDTFFNFITFNIIKWNEENGIFVDGSNNTIYDNSIFSNQYYGIRLIDSNSNTISFNFIEKNGFWGETVWGGGGIKLDNSSFNIISQNNLSRNCLFSINLVYYSKNNIISGNKISQNSMSVGIELYETCDDTYVSGNTIANNFIGININSNNNTIEKNNFFRNLHSTFFSTFNNSWNQNYWNRPRFLPKLIFGMVEINSKWKFHICIDKNPAKIPWNLN
jgi:parallel beta-helix repeat protein